MQKNTRQHGNNFVIKVDTGFWIYFSFDGSSSTRNGITTCNLWHFCAYNFFWQEKITEIGYEILRQFMKNMQYTRAIFRKCNRPSITLKEELSQSKRIQSLTDIKKDFLYTLDTTATFRLPFRDRHSAAHLLLRRCAMNDCYFPFPISLSSITSNRYIILPSTGRTRSLFPPIIIGAG